MNLQELWKQYRDKCYPPDMAADQNRECHQAFMAGAFSALTEIQVIGANVQDEDEAAQQVGNLCREAEQWCELRIRALESGRN